MANTTPVRQHILNALAAGFKYEQAQAREAAKSKRNDVANARLARAYQLALAHERLAKEGA